MAEVGVAKAEDREAMDGMEKILTAEAKMVTMGKMAEAEVGDELVAAAWHVHPAEPLPVEAFDHQVEFPAGRGLRLAVHLR